MTSLECVHSISIADGGAHALFRSIAGADWGTTFSFVSAPGPATFFLRPWLCPRVSNAVSASLRGALAIEECLVDLDDTGKFWTNGQLGDGVLSICRYGSGNGSGGDEATFQDGPDLCAESARAGTQIEIVDAQ